jgi:hypothetical protein
MEVKTITLDELQPGYVYFIRGFKSMAKKIQFFQKLKYPKQFIMYLGQMFYYYLLNHTGHLDKDIEGNLISYEQDNPGKYHTNLFNLEYVQQHADVWIGVPKCDISTGIHQLRYAAEVLAGEDTLLNYSYKSIIGFAINAVWYRLFKKDIWVTGIPKGTTCSQIVAKLFQKAFGMFMQKAFHLWMPCELAMSEEITLYKLVY